MELLEVPQTEWAALISLLEEENFLNEERFASAYVRGKHRHNGWGRAKIRFNLRQKGVPIHYITHALFEELPDSLYLETLQSKLASRLRTLKTKDDVYTQKQKLAHYLSQLGYESELVWSAINGLGLK
jgi:regulatory protein